jgi:CspA family cold shock protein
MDKHEGTVVWFDNKQGIGFLSWELNGTAQKDMFVHFSDIVCDGFKTIKKGHRVSFGIGQNNKGQPKAIEVTVINEKNQQS